MKNNFNSTAAALVQRIGKLRTLSFLLLALAIGLIAVPPALMQESSPRSAQLLGGDGSEEYIDGQIIVQLQPGFQIATVATMYGLDPNPIGALTLSADPPEVPVTNYLLRIVDGSTVTQKVAQMAPDTLRILIVEPHYIHSAPEAARPSWSVGDSYSPVAAGRKMYNGQWSRRTIKLDEAHQISRGATTANPPVPVVIAVLDTGIDLSHPMFAGRLVPGYDFVDGDDNPSEAGRPEIGPFGHGTHVAGIIAMVAPEAKIMPIRVLGTNGRGTAFTLALGVKFAVDHGADVINMSVSTPNEMEIVQDVFYHELEGPEDFPPGSMPGAVAVVAAGNSGLSVKQYPAGVVDTGRPGREVLAVAASDWNDLLTSFSTRGNWVSVMAPGERITSPVPYNHYANWSGTSMAAPLVAGEVALIRAVNPNAEPKDVVSHVKSFAVQVAGQRPRIDVLRALTNPVND
jgi:hypothetical protein